MDDFVYCSSADALVFWQSFAVYCGHSLVSYIVARHGRPHIGANGVSWPPWKNGWKINKRKHAKKSSFPYLCYILRAIRAGRYRERRYADHIFIQIYFRMHHFVVKFSSPQAARGHWPPQPKYCGRSCRSLQWQWLQSCFFILNRWKTATCTLNFHFIAVC